MNKINKDNLIYVNCETTVKTTTTTTTTTESCGYPFYALNQLKAVQWKVKFNRALRILSQTTCKTIRHLRIQKKRKCGSHGQDLHWSNHKTRTVNINNLWHLKHTEMLTQTDPSCNFALTLVNMQSLKNKDTVLLDHLIEKKTDICIVTDMAYRK